MRRLVKCFGYALAHIQSRENAPLGVSIQEMMMWFSVVLIFLFVIGKIPW